jgi:membrane-bound ClpP family serine protease
MFILNLVPDSWINFAALMILSVGIVLFIVGHLINYSIIAKQYGLPLRIVGGILLLIGTYLNGGLGVEKEYRARIKLMQEKVNIAEEKSKQENIKIVEKIVKETKVIKEDTENTKQLIKQMRDRINKQGCELSPETIELYNRGVVGDIK